VGVRTFLAVRVSVRAGLVAASAVVLLLLQDRPVEAYVGNYKALYWSALRHEALGHFSKSRSRYLGGLSEQRRWWHRLDETIADLTQRAETASAKEKHSIEMELAFLQMRVAFHRELAAQAQAEAAELSLPDHGSVAATLPERQFVFMWEKRAIAIEISAARAEQDGSDFARARELWTQAIQARTDGAIAIRARIEQVRSEQAARATTPSLPPGIIIPADDSGAVLEDPGPDGAAEDEGRGGVPDAEAVTEEPSTTSAGSGAGDTMQACIDYLSTQETRFADLAAHLQAEQDWATDPTNVLARARYFEGKATLYGGIYHKVYEDMAAAYLRKAAFACDLKTAADPALASDMATLKGAIVEGKAKLPDAAAPTWYYPLEYELRLYEFSLGSPEAFVAPPAS